MCLSLYLGSVLLGQSLTTYPALLSLAIGVELVQDEAGAVHQRGVQETFQDLVGPATKFLTNKRRNENTQEGDEIVP